MTVLPRPSASADAVVLRTWPTGETSVIASTVTAEHGFVRLIAKGARGERSVLRPLVQPGRLVNAEFSLRPDRELQYLKGGQVLLDPAAAGPGLERTAYLLAALELLDLRNNRLVGLSAGLEQLTNLRYLDLRANQLRTVPEALSQLPNLRRLDLRWNKLTHEPAWLGELVARGCLVYL